MNDVMIAYYTYSKESDFYFRVILYNHFVILEWRERLKMTTSFNNNMYFDFRVLTVPLPVFDPAGSGSIGEKLRHCQL